MKTTKEFPATHSMSTQWFIADEEGNIALFDFEEEGPVPVQIDESEDFGYLEDLGELDEDGISFVELNQEQVNYILNRLIPISNLTKDDEYNSFVQLKDDEESKKAFLKTFKEDIELCISHKERIYYVRFFWSFNATEKQIEESVNLIKNTCSGFYHEFFEPENLNSDSVFPLYCYRQPYNSNAYIPERTAVPKNPLKETQLSEEKRKKLIRVPVKFSECNGLQIAQYVICKSYSIYNGIEIDGRFYAEYPKTGGGFCYILQDQDKDKDGEIPIIIEQKD